MNPAYGIYRSLMSLSLVAAFPAYWGYSRITNRSGADLRERLGLFPSRTLGRRDGNPRVWLHAASLGEVKVASAIHRALSAIVPELGFLVTTTTEHGRALARETFPGIPAFYAPMDVPVCLRRALSRARPDVMVFLETEIWPAWIVEAHRMGFKIVLANGRVSSRSAKTYLKFRSFFREVLKRVDTFSMIREEDASRIEAMGAPRERIRVNGNAKYDFLAGQTDPDTEEKMRHALDLGRNRPAFVAGSTRRGEEIQILKAYEAIRKRWPDLLLVIAPRHIHRTREIISLLQGRGHRYQLWTDITEKGEGRKAPVVLVNTYGELFDLYSIGTLSFCGGSLVSLGGQNPLEPAVWGRLPFFGPSMEAFLDARDLLLGVEGAFEVSSWKDLAEKALGLLDRPDALEAGGRRARDGVMTHQKAAVRHARIIADFL